MRTHKSIITDNWDICYVMHIGICTTKATDCHHMLNGSSVSRNRCDRYGLVIPICRACHTYLHNNPSALREYKKIAQTAFEKQFSREQFIKEFHKNYLED